MFQFNFDTFMGSFRSAFPPPYTKMTAGLQFVLGKIGEDNDNWANLSQIAYGLATFKWETGHTFQPVVEFSGKQGEAYFKKYDPGTATGKRLGNTEPGDGARFKGRGYVQLTGRGNYTNAGNKLGIDLIGNPASALDPEVAYKIAARGMKEGWFSGRGLSRYIASDDKADFKAARQIINGHDHDTDIAAIAVKVLGALKVALVPGA